MAECGDAEPAWHDGGSAKLDLQGTKGGPLGLREWVRGSGEQTR